MSFFEVMMRHAAPVLFWTAILLLLGGIASYLLINRTMMPTGSGINAQTIVVAISQGLSAAVWPFTGAGLIWTLQRQRKGQAE